MNNAAKLADISRIMADGLHFVNMRFLLEGFDESHPTTAELFDIVDKFYKLCKYVETKGSNNA